MWYLKQLNVISKQQNIKTNKTKAKCKQQNIIPKTQDFIQNNFSDLEERLTSLYGGGQMKGKWVVCHRIKNGEPSIIH